jgi:hypothetical protein
MREWKNSITIFDLGTRWRLVSSFTTRPLYLPGKEHRYLLHKMLDESQSWTGHCGVEKNVAIAGNRTRSVEPAEPVATELPRFFIQSVPMVITTGV